MRETGKNGYQKLVKDRLKKTFPGCMIFRTDPNELQGAPDLLILFENKWASLETKGFEKSGHQPNQDYYVSIMNEMSFSRFIFPEIENNVFDLLIAHFYKS